MAAGCVRSAALPAAFGIAGYVAPIVVVTAGYALFQAANNTAVMADVRPDRRGVISGLLNLSRNLGLITGASVMGAVFAFASASTDIGQRPTPRRCHRHADHLRRRGPAGAFGGCAGDRQPHGSRGAAGHWVDIMTRAEVA